MPCCPLSGSLLGMCHFLLDLLEVFNTSFSLLVDCECSPANQGNWWICPHSLSQGHTLILVLAVICWTSTWFVSILEGRDEGFAMTVHFTSCIVQGWVYSRPQIEYIKSAGVSFAAVICFSPFSDIFWKPQMADPLESHKEVFVNPV